MTMAAMTKMMMMMKMAVVMTKTVVMKSARACVNFLRVGFYERAISQ